MKSFLKIASGIDTVPILAELGRHPELWDQNAARRVAPESPHREMQDIWLRHRAPHEIAQPKSHAEFYQPIFYPAFVCLPSVRPLLIGPTSLMGRLNAVQLGSVLITKVPAGSQIYPHVDDGTWHAKFFNTKVYVVLQGNDQCVNFGDDDVVTMKTGDAWIFDNQVVHSMANMGDDDRISLIAAYRVEEK